MNNVRAKVKILLTLLWTACAVLAAPGVNRYAVILEGPPVVEQLKSETKLQKIALKTAAAASHRAQVLSAQATVRTAVLQNGVSVLGAHQDLVNAIFVQATPEQAELLRKLPGVALVDRLRPMK